MATPLPLDDNEPLEDMESEPMEGEEDMDMGETSPDVDPMFAADIAEAFPDLDDTQIAAIQRAVLGLVAGGGGGAGGPPGGLPPMGF